MQPHLDVEASALATKLWGLRFAKPSTEAAYRTWHLNNAVAITRVATVASFVGWAMVLGASIIARPRGLELVATLILVLMLAFVAHFAATFASAGRRWMLALATVNTALAGCLGVGLGAWTFQMPALSISAAAVVSFMAFTVFRLPLVQALLSAASFLIFDQGVLIDAFSSGQLTRVELTMFTLVPWVAFVMAFCAGAMNERASHASYGQGRIIAAQQHAIALQQQRATELEREAAERELRLLNAEVRRQVAERARDLSEALASGHMGAGILVTPPEIGERFHGRYKVERVLGMGGMGVVFEVERSTDARRLALKVVTGQVTSEGAARFAREAEIGAKVHHPNLVSIVDVGVSDGGAPFLVMELVQGSSLEDHRSSFGKTEWAVRILRQIAAGLSALHRANVVHRDLKPANVLLAGGADDPQVKISDFGISRFRTVDALVDVEAATMESARRKPNELTRTDALLGTPLYMAPEAMKGGRAVDAAADIFAFGILAYEVLTSRTPFAMPPVLIAMSGQPLPVPSSEGMTDAIGKLTLDCLCKDPAQRPTAHAILDALSRA